MLNLKAKKIQFHIRFQSVTSLLGMKRDQEFMSWLKANKIDKSVMNLRTTENARAGFFLGKAPHLTKLEYLENGSGRESKHAWNHAHSSTLMLKLLEGIKTQEQSAEL